MNEWNNIKQLGFTLIELAIIVIILGILAVIAIPKYVALGDSARIATELAVTGSVKSAFALSIAESTGVFPTVATLGANVKGSTAVVGGIEVNIGGDIYTVPTYTDSNCSALSTSTTQSVLCIE